MGTFERNDTNRTAGNSGRIRYQEQMCSPDLTTYETRSANLSIIRDPEDFHTSSLTPGNSLLRVPLLEELIEGNAKQEAHQRDRSSTAMKTKVKEPVHTC